MPRIKIASLAVATLAAAGLVPLSPIPARATLNWDYQCTANDEHVGLDLTVVFITGTVGPISIVNVGGKLTVKDPTASIAFVKDDVEQFWTMDDEFRLSASQIPPEEQFTRLQIDTTCKERVCTGIYVLGYRGKPVSGPISCKQREPG